MSNLSPYDATLAGMMRAALIKKIENVTYDMVNGHPKDYPAYRELVGKAHGLADAIETIDDVRKVMAGETESAS